MKCSASRSSLVPRLLLLSVLLAAGAYAHGFEHHRSRWLSAWTVSHGARQVPTGVPLSGSSFRMIVRPTVSGDHVRVKIENTMGQAPLVISAAYIGVLDSGAALVPHSNVRLTFGGRPGLTLGPGPGLTSPPPVESGAYSDPVRFKVRAFQRLAVSLEVTTATDVSAHALGLVTNYWAAGGHASSTSGDGFTAIPDGGGNFPFFWVAAVDVESDDAEGTVVAFGDSITDGRCSTRDAAGVDRPDLYLRWVDVLAQRISGLPHSQRKAVVDEGIAGNRIRGGGSPAALDRLDRDVLDRAGLSHVIFFEGTNDITGGALAPQVIADTKTIINRVHAAGVPIFGVTIMPRARPAPLTGWTGSMESQRLQVNHWMHAPDADGITFDGLIDFGSLTAGPIVVGSDAVPGESIWTAPGGTVPSLTTSWNCGDYTHPNTPGYDAMGNSIDLGLFHNPRAFFDDD
ncbi:MAG TPA: GDSL-type esterase/lipase family protein [Myxococcales bacterium]|nr:GDSL-type esterase/lipase family protein [Myxococcales bacterium]